MTQTRKEALEALLEKVKAGAFDHTSAAWIPIVGDGVEKYMNARRAFDGSPTAAYGFHEMMLPGTHTVLADEASGLGYVAEVFDLERDGTIGHGHADTRGRALLIADLQALIAQEGEE